MAGNPPSFTDAVAYTATLGDVAVWRPLASAAMQLVGLPPGPRWEIAGVGSFPTLRTGDGTIVKLYSPYFDGCDCAVAEVAALLALRGKAAVPELLGHGELYPGAAWTWPFAVMTELAGMSITKLRAGKITAAQLVDVAGFAGKVLSDIWSVPPPMTSGRLQRGWGPFLKLLEGRRRVAVAEHRAAGKLSPALCSRLEEWLPTPAELVGTNRPPVFLHADLHGDHLLAVRSDRHRLAGSGVIDLSDAIAGDAAYDLVALHLDAFAGSPPLLAAAVAAMPTPPRRSARHMLAFSVLHEFDPFERWEGEHAHWLHSFDDPDTLADALWAPARAALTVGSGETPTKSPSRPFMAGGGDRPGDDG